MSLIFSFLLLLAALAVAGATHWFMSEVTAAQYAEVEQLRTDFPQITKRVRYHFAHGQQISRYDLLKIKQYVEQIKQEQARKQLDQILQAWAHEKLEKWRNDDDVSAYWETEIKP